MYYICGMEDSKNINFLVVRLTKNNKKDSVQKDLHNLIDKCKKNNTNLNKLINLYFSDVVMFLDKQVKQS